ncbi:L,D-transpeptidase [Thiohalorhabdus sp. Cl-TMA]|uniref:L,D-transpeptidase n=1 Tax=Thiohalorhabdus methylotrophus TaxID=3242694 RepID=A0ABV4TUD7_9GAMM
MYRSRAAVWLSSLAITGLLLPCRAGATSGPTSELSASRPTVEAVTRPKTFQLRREAPLRQWPGGETVERWEGDTLLTSDRRAGEWVRVTGHFPQGHWQPMESPLWVRAEHLRIVRPFRPKHPVRQRVRARTYRLERDILVRDRPRGHPVATWEEGDKFTVRWRRGGWLEVSGYFPEGRWKPVERTLWVPAGAARDVSPPPTVPLPEGAERHIVVDKSEFQLRVLEERPDGSEQQLYSTEVGLGMDDCLPEEQGGNCYYTEPGDYRVRWRIYKPDGIDWCIPDSMTKEERYAEDIEKGKRCFEGVLGKFALNIGKTYAIHGTNNPDSIGRKESHGCIRVRPEAAKALWRYMREGDRVTIRP